MITIYPLEWIDSLILLTLNPNKSNIGNLSQSDLVFITENLSRESHKIQIQMKNEIFALQKKRQIRLLVRKYHSTLVYLLDNIIENQNNEALKGGFFLRISESIINTLDDLLYFIENRYPNYLNLDERVPVPYLLVSRKEILLKIGRLSKKKTTITDTNQVLQIVIDAITVSNQINAGNKITYREVLYQKELLKKLEMQLASESKSNFYSAVDELLIEVNFNDSFYISHFIKNIVNRLKCQETLADKIGELLFCYKEFSQLSSSERIAFDPSKQNINFMLENWFKHEIKYLERKKQLSAEFDENNAASESMQIGEDKVECTLSTDQMALILRAGDESRVLKAKSMSLVFKTIVPFLSTPFKKNLSYQSVRSKSYNAEDRDKEIAIQTLKKIIEKIKSY
ncbi:MULTISPECIES: hypothetical protein [Flavobacterium]|uniref:Uncharacterized protein n=1 Tax=Flavobacterium cutihirudinis TaxID=1265740 RepID=A0A3D9G1F3_9FLAO|nr:MULTISPECIES: hypothetical protein [Flavobacterium]MBZ4040955.1 hypothetical protein [Flavobacterium hibisci]RED27019.1 hypothetical protein BD847_0950 [Flavobacterium cutihirudinis]